jgi:hypothetical protein
MTGVNFILLKRKRVKRKDAKMQSRKETKRTLELPPGFGVQRQSRKLSGDAASEGALGLGTIVPQSKAVSPPPDSGAPASFLNRDLNLCVFAPLRLCVKN